MTGTRREPPAPLPQDVLDGAYRCSTCCLLDARSALHAVWHLHVTGQEPE